MMKKGITNMNYLNFKSEYDKNPIIKMKIENPLLWDQETDIVLELSKITSGVLVFETYPGIDLDTLKMQIIDKLNPNHLINIEDYTKSEAEIDQMIKPNLTDDRVFGFYSNHVITDFYDHEKLNFLKDEINKYEGLVVVYGFGASQIKSDYL
ncbi:MAG: hypothetical protein CVV62_02530, partial [Tenericutes bacterium HGW-Tenericutes-7]